VLSRHSLDSSPRAWSHSSRANELLFRRRLARWHESQPTSVVTFELSCVVDDCSTSLEDESAQIMQDLETGSFHTDMFGHVPSPSCWVGAECMFPLSALHGEAATLMQEGTALVYKNDGAPTYHRSVIVQETRFFLAASRQSSFL